MVEVAGALRSPGALLYLGGRAMREPALRAAARISAASGCRVVHETFVARHDRGAGIPSFEAVPYFPEQAVPFLAGTTTAVLAGAGEPVAFFGYPGQPSRLLPEDAHRLVLADTSTDVDAALEGVAAELGAPPTVGAPGAEPGSASQGGVLDPGTLGRTVAALQPAGAIVVNEAATSGLPYVAASADSLPHTRLDLTGGAIGQGLPCAVGAAVAAPERRVIALQADGSGMYTLQALWTMAREALDVTVVICSNRRYRILQYELFRAGVSEPGPNAAGLTDLSHPPLDWVALATGMGVPAVSATDAEGFAGELRRSLSTPGPSLIEAVLP